MVEVGVLVCGVEAGGDEAVGDGPGVPAGLGEEADGLAELAVAAVGARGLARLGGPGLGEGLDFVGGLGLGRWWGHGWMLDAGSEEGFAVAVGVAGTAGLALVVRRPLSKRVWIMVRVPVTVTQGWGVAALQLEGLGLGRIKTSRRRAAREDAGGKSEHGGTERAGFWLHGGMFD